MHEKNLALEFVRVTEAAAIAASRWIGKGDKIAADGAAVEAMRKRFHEVAFNGTVVIGEGEKDEAPELYVGEHLGNTTGDPLDIAVDPLECTDSVAYGRYNAMSVIATGPKGTLLHAPDTYMEKLAVGPRAKHAISLDAPLEENIHKVAQALDKPVEEVTVIMLDRERHKELIKRVRKVKARIRLITDGDVSAAIATCKEESGVDMLIGTGGSTEAVLASVPIRIFGGELLARFKPKNDADKAKIEALGQSLTKVYTATDMAQGNTLTFTATGIIDGPLLNGVVWKQDGVITHSISMRMASGTVRYITTHHRLKSEAK